MLCQKQLNNRNLIYLNLILQIKKNNNFKKNLELINVVIQTAISLN